MGKYVGKLTPWQIVDAFPEECETILPREIRKLKKELKFYLKIIDGICEEYPDDIERKIMISLVRCYMPFVETYVYDHLMEIKKVYDLTKKIKIDVDIDKARIKPIQDLYSFEKVKKNGKRINCLCPFHHEKTPSFVIYLKSNSYYCFGCGVGGDSINFMMKIKGCEFLEAVKYLI